jgi:hypothetical protein
VEMDLTGPGVPHQLGTATCMHLGQRQVQGWGTGHGQGAPTALLPTRHLFGGKLHNSLAEVPATWSQSPSHWLPLCMHSVCPHSTCSSSLFQKRLSPSSIYHYPRVLASLICPPSSAILAPQSFQISPILTQPFTQLHPALKQSNLTCCLIKK